MRDELEAEQRKRRGQDRAYEERCNYIRDEERKRQEMFKTMNDTAMEQLREERKRIREHIEHSDTDGKNQTSAFSHFLPFDRELQERKERLATERKRKDEERQKRIKMKKTDMKRAALDGDSSLLSGIPNKRERGTQAERDETAERILQETELREFESFQKLFPGIALSEGFLIPRFVLNHHKSFIFISIVFIL